MKFIRLKYFLIIVCVGLIFCSCHPEKKLAELVYFNDQGDSSLASKVQSYEAIIQPGDRLSIVVNALNPASAAPYNLGSGATATTVGSANALGYIVEEDGTIQFPQLGKLKVSGMNRKQLIDILSGKLVKYVNDPVVTVQFLNFKITVLGEVTRQGTFSIPEGKITMIEALGLAGDLTFYARRDNILVIGEREGRREFGRINLLSKRAFSSPYFVLQQNDVVYVELTKAKVATSDQLLVRNLTIATSVISVLSTLVVLIINVTR